MFHNFTIDENKKVWNFNNDFQKKPRFLSISGTNFQPTISQTHDFEAHDFQAGLYLKSVDFQFFSCQPIENAREIQIIIVVNNFPVMGIIWKLVS